MDKWVIFARYGIWGRQETGTRNQEEVDFGRKI